MTCDRLSVLPNAIDANTNCGAVRPRRDRILKPDDSIQIWFAGHRECPPPLPARVIERIRIGCESTLKPTVKTEFQHLIGPLLKYGHPPIPGAVTPIRRTRT